MSKNITIQEGGVARTLSGVEKIVTNVVGGGTQNWVPEDEAANYVTTGELSVSENGTYYASDDGYVGFSKVEVDVEGGGGDEPTLITKTITENGTYDASDDDADGYSSVEVNVESATIPGIEMQGVAVANITKGSAVEITQASGAMTKINNYSSTSTSFLANNILYEMAVISGVGKIRKTNIVTGEVTYDEDSVDYMSTSYGKRACAYQVNGSTSTSSGYSIRYKIFFDDGSSCYLTIPNSSSSSGTLNFGYANNIIAVYYFANEGYTIVTYDKSGNLLNTVTPPTARPNFSLHGIYPHSSTQVEIFCGGGSETVAHCFAASHPQAWTPVFQDYTSQMMSSYVACDETYSYFYYDRNQASASSYYPYAYAMYRLAHGSQGYAEAYAELASNYPYPIRGEYNPTYKHIVMRDNNGDSATIYDLTTMQPVDATNLSESYSAGHQYLESGGYLVFNGTYQKSAGSATMRQSSNYPKDGSQVYLGFAKDNVSQGATGTAIIVFS